MSFILNMLSSYWNSKQRIHTGCLSRGIKNRAGDWAEVVNYQFINVFQFTNLDDMGRWRRKKMGTEGMSYFWRVRAEGSVCLSGKSTWKLGADFQSR